MGPWRHLEIREALSWIKTDVKILGIIYSDETMQAKNFKPIIDTIQQRLEKWEKRNYIIEGRANMLNLYEFPKLLYRLNTVEIPKKLLGNYSTHIYNFIWNNKIHKIQKATITKPKESGGIGLHNLQIRQEAYTIKIISDCIQCPDEDHTVLLRKSIGYIPKLENTIKPHGKVTYPTGDSITNQRRRRTIRIS